MAAPGLTAGPLPLRRNRVPLLFLPGTITPGVVFGAMFVLHPTWNAVVMAHRIRLTPDALLGRVQSVATLLSSDRRRSRFSAAASRSRPFGTTPTVLAFLGLMLVVATAAAVSPAIRSAPD